MMKAGAVSTNSAAPTPRSALASRIAALEDAIARNGAKSARATDKMDKVAVPGNDLEAEIKHLRSTNKRLLSTWWNLQQELRKLEAEKDDKVLQLEAEVRRLKMSQTSGEKTSERDVVSLSAHSNNLSPASASASGCLSSTSSSTSAQIMVGGHIGSRSLGRQITPAERSQINMLLAYAHNPFASLEQTNPSAPVFARFKQGQSQAQPQSYDEKASVRQAPATSINAKNATTAPTSSVLANDPLSIASPSIVISSAAPAAATQSNNNLAPNEGIDSISAPTQSTISASSSSSQYGSHVMMMPFNMYQDNNIHNNTPLRPAASSLTTAKILSVLASPVRFAGLGGARAGHTKSSGNKIDRDTAASATTTAHQHGPRS